MEANPYTREGASLMLGENGEGAVAKILEGHGLDVEEVGGQRFDILLNGRVTVEVKTALPTSGSGGNKTRWQFMLHKRSRGRPVEEHVLILRCQEGIEDGDQAWHFVIPGDYPGLGQLTKIDITSEPGAYRGKWAKYLEAWPILYGIISQAERENWPRPTEKEIPF